MKEEKFNLIDDQGRVFDSIYLPVEYVRSIGASAKAHGISFERELTNILEKGLRRLLSENPGFTGQR